MNTSTPLLKVRGLCKYFPVFSTGFFKRQTGLVRAVDNVSFDLMAGETLGIVGESGSGKTTAGRSILRAINPTAGQVLFTSGGATVDLAKLSEKELKKYRVKMQMIFQDPFSSLNPRMTVGDIVGEPLLIHNIAKGSDKKDRIESMLKKVGLKPEHSMRYPHAFSGGQRQRIGIARALILHPDFVVADEAVSALDVSVQAQVINLLKDLQEELGLTIIFIAHNLGVVRHLCTHVAVMYAGRIVELSPTEALFEDPKHPYTKALLSAVPDPDPDIPMRFGVPGEVADVGNLPKGCSFCSRCPDAMEICGREVPEFREITDNQSVACHRF